MVCADSPVRVSVDGVEIPTVGGLSSDRPTGRDDPLGCQTRLRPDGPGAVTRRSTVHTASVWQDRDVLSETGLDGGQGGHYTVRVEYYDDSLDTHVPVHVGPLTGLGSGPAAPEHLRLTVGDYAQWLGKIPASTTFGKRTTVAEVFTYVAERTNEIGDDRLPVNLDIGAQSVEASKIIQGGPYTFQRNKHTLVNVLNQTVGERRWHISPTSENLSDTGVAEASTDLTLERYVPTVVHVSDTPSTGDRTDSPLYTRQYPVSVVDNGALQALQPINTVRVNGANLVGANQSVGPDDALRWLGQELTGSGPPTEFPYAVARHPVLYERAGGVELQPPDVYAKNVTDVASAEQQAIDELERRLDDNRSGTVTVRGHPPIRPQEGLYTPPACDGTVRRDVTPLTYAVDRVRHVASPTDGYWTELDVGVRANPVEDIEIARSGYKQTDSDDS